MNLDKSEQYIVRHAGTTPGGGGTTRILIWFEADPTRGFRSFLDRQCDALGVQGVMGIVPATMNDQNTRVFLIISNEVNVAAAAAAWIEGINALIPTLLDKVLESFQHESKPEETMAVSSLTGSLDYEV